MTLFGVKVSTAAPAEEDEPPALPDAAVKKTPLPEPPPAPAPAPAPAVKEEKPAEPPASKRFLIVDDQKVNLIVLKTMLKKIGQSDVVTAEDGQKALDILTSTETPFDFVLTDMWMPVMDGEGLVHAVRADKRLAALPVHVVTADTEMPGKYREIGFDGILLKPVTVEKLREIIG